MLSLLTLLYLQLFYHHCCNSVCSPLAGAFFTFFTGPISRIGGRKLVMIMGGASFCVGAILCAFAQDLAMLIIGRVCLGAGVGFANQVCSPTCGQNLQSYTYCPYAVLPAPV